MQTIRVAGAEVLMLVMRIYSLRKKGVWKVYCADCRVVAPKILKLLVPVGDTAYISSH